MKLQIGKKGLTEEFINQAKDLFKKEKNVRISMLKSATRDKAEAKQIADKLVAALGPNYRYILVGYTIIVKRGKK